MEVKAWVVEFSHAFPKNFVLEEDGEDGHTAPFTSTFLQDEDDVSGS